jgi:L-threonylcarbamoyladenylate synthase
LRETAFVKTLLTRSPSEAADFIKKGGIVAFPTETVYGLGANVFDADAVARIFEAKLRPGDNPLIAHVANLEQIRELASDINQNAQRFIDRFFPGPLTLVLPKSDLVPSIATAGLGTIGVRMPRNKLARRFLDACEVPVVAPSANLSGKPSPTTWQAVLEDLDGRIDCILKGDATEIGLESTVVDCTGDVPVLLRQGAISIAELRAAVQETVASIAVGDAPRSPGLKHKHYSPRAAVVLVPVGTWNDSDRGPDSSVRSRLQPGKLRSKSFPVLTQAHAAFIGISETDERFEIRKICDSVEDYAHSLFEFFRESDRRNIDTIYCEEVAEDGIGGALMDRLRRAAES